MKTFPLADTRTAYSAALKSTEIYSLQNFHNCLQLLATQLLVMKLQKTNPSAVDTPKSSAAQMTSLSITEEPCCLESDSLLLPTIMEDKKMRWALLCLLLLQLVGSHLRYMFDNKNRDLYYFVLWWSRRWGLWRRKKYNITTALRWPLPSLAYDTYSSSLQLNCKFLTFKSLKVN